VLVFAFAFAFAFVLHHAKAANAMLALPHTITWQYEAIGA
jgi:hypothetical protein